MQREGSMIRFASPLRPWVQRFPFLLTIMVAVGLIVLGKADTILIERARSAIADASVPLLELMARPAAAIAELVDNVREIGSLRSDNVRLREEQQQLLQWQIIARQLDAENQMLRKLVRLAPDPKLSFVSARVIADYGGAFFRSVLVAAGERNGVRKGQAVINGDGLVGRVFEVGSRSARLLLLTDINSRVPVVIERTRDRAVLAGDNSNYPRLLYLAPEASPRPGDRVVTSGSGGVFVAGLPVGLVSAVVGGGVIVQPFVDWDRLDYVRLVDYELPRALLAPVGSDKAVRPR
jgi:rod shape-determining protein MreC